MSAATGMTAASALCRRRPQPARGRCATRPHRERAGTEADDGSGSGHQDHARGVVPRPAMARGGADRADAGRRDARGAAHAGTRRHRPRMRRRALPLRREPPRDQRHDRVLPRADGRDSHRDRLRRGRCLPQAGGHGLPPPAAGGGRGTADRRHARPAGGVRAGAPAYGAAAQVHPDRPAHAGEGADRPSLRRSSPRSPTPSPTCLPDRSRTATPT